MKTETILGPFCSPYVQPWTNIGNNFEIKELCKSWVIEWLEKNGCEKEAESLRSCSTKTVSLVCYNGHQKLVLNRCRKEYCTVCGEKGSFAHKRNYLRAFDRLLWAQVLGYLIFTLPKEVSEAMPDKLQLSKLETEATRITQGNFSTPGSMVRIHLMGEKISELHVHVNVLFPVTGTNGKGEVSLIVLDNIKKQWTELINKTFNRSEKTTDVHYRFAAKKSKMVHMLKYVTRPIVTADKFLSLSNAAKHYILSLKGWRNTRWYGQLADSKCKKFLKTQNVDPEAHREADIALAKKCPVCGEKFKFKGFVDVCDINKSQFRQIDEDCWVDLEIYAALKNKDSPPEP